MIERNGGTVDIQEGHVVVNAPDCYDRFTSIFPNLHFAIANERHGLPITNLVFDASDYLDRTSNPDICHLMVTRGGPTGGPLRLTDHLTRKIGGIHFRYYYFDDHIGFFDPL